METQTQQRNEPTAATTESASGRNFALGIAVLGLLLAGVVGVFKAGAMTNGLDVLLCLLGSSAAFGMVFYIYLARR